MKRISIIISLCMLCAFRSFDQPEQTKNFESFSIRLDSLFIQAYQQGNTKYYHQLLTEFQKKYNRLDANAKAIYSNSYQNAYYNLCCTYALANNKRRALTYLEKTIKEAGYTNYSHMQEDSDLNNIRNESLFKTLLQPLRKAGDYLYILQQSGIYNKQDNRTLPPFTYATITNEHLVQLRAAFNLDSIAGSGNTISKVINFMHWVHNLIPHDGNHNNPDGKNAKSLIAVCKRDNRGLNCRGLATVLNECYLSLGIPSRFVTCLPKDSLHIDPDCHVINTVFIDSLHKWIWIDPTNDAYVMNEKGELLGIEEVRKRLVDNLPLALNADAN